VSQKHWCTCLHYRWSKSDGNIPHLQYLCHFPCYNQCCLPVLNMKLPVTVFITASFYQYKFWVFITCWQ
jgi:hypothetical protein